MGHLHSCVKEIEDANWNRFPTKGLFNISKLFRIGGTVFAITKNGTLYTDGNMCKNMILTDHQVTNPCVVALKRLGVITAKQLQEHQDWCKRYQENTNIYYALKYDAEKFERVGVKFTKSQLAKIERLREDLDVDALGYYERRDWEANNS